LRETGDDIEALRAGWGSALKPASYRGLLCFAPDRGRNVTFTSPSTWLRAKDRVRRAPAGDAALGEVLRRFVVTHGPATRAEAARWWGGISAPKAERILRSVEGLAEVDLDGASAWIDAGDVEALLAAEPTTTVRLLPTFDQYVIGSTASVERLLPRDGFRDRVHRQAGWVSPVVTVGGRIEGVWSHVRSGRRLRVEVNPFRRRSARLREGVEAEADRLATFLGGVLDLTWA
jgi:DNA glycosylase AlkZ-like